MSDMNNQNAPVNGPAIPPRPAPPVVPTADAPTTPLPPELANALRADTQQTTPLGRDWAQPADAYQPMAQPTHASAGAPASGSVAPGAPATSAPAFATPTATTNAAPGAAFGVTAHPTPHTADGGSLPPGAPVPPQSNAFGEPTVPEPEKKPRKRVGATIGLVTATALIAAGAGFGGSWAYNTLFDDGARPVATAGGETITVNNPGSVTQTTAVAAEALPSVVTIDVGTDRAAGSGSGVIISEDGYVLTNTHVVTLDGATGAADVRVTLSDGTIYQAEVVGTDPIYDLAVIKLKDARDLPVITWGDSSKLNVGDVTVALGAPLGLSNSVTEGIVSTLNRSISVASSAAPETPDSGDSNDDENSQGGPFTFDMPGDQGSTPSASISIAVIQTDAAINPGNSGGALVNGEGDLIGINVAIATAGGNSNSAGSIGLGFAIPSNIAQRIANEIIENGEATHGLLGASVTSASSMKDATIAGAYIAEVVEGGAAEGAGLQEGDVVTKFGGARISSSIDLTAQVRALAGGADTTLTYVRDGKAFEIDVTLGSL